MIMRSSSSLFARLAAIVSLCLALCLAMPQSAPAMGTSPQQDTSQNATAKTAQPPAPQDLNVRIGYNNMGGGKGALRFQFNLPMIDPAKTPLGQAIAPEQLPFTVTPAIAGEGKWADQQTLIFSSYEAVPRATSISVAFREGTAALNGKKLEQKPVSFTPYPLTYTAQQVRYAKDGTVTIRLYFQCKVDPAKVKTALSVTTKEGKKLPFELEPATGEAAGFQMLLLVKPEQFGELTIALPEGFTSEEGPQGITKNAATRTVNATSMFAVRTVRPRQSDSPPWSRYIEVNTTNDVDIATVRQYLDITPETDIKVEARSGGFIITGDFITKPRLSLTFKKGMPGILGVLTEDFKSTVVFNDFSPRLAFDTQGTILSPNRSMRIPLSTINVERVQATLWQLPESNIPLMGMGFFDGYKKHLSRKLAVRTGDVNAVRNRAAVNSIDLTQIAGKAKGVFLLTVADASDPKKVRSDEVRDPDDYYGDDDMASQVEKLVVISDIGITARIMPEGITVWANSIATTDAIKNARVRVFTANNVLLAEGRTDNDGLWQHVRKTPWEGRERPALVLVSVAGDPKAEAPKAEAGLAEPSVADMAYLKLDSNLAADSAFDTGGREYLKAGYEAFCFMPRGIFRPGESVDFKVLVRDAQLKAPQPFPVAWAVTSSTGRTVGRGTAMLSGDGGAAFNLPLVPSAPTGKYLMSVTLPGQKKTLGFCQFAVEDFAPPRIEVKLSAEAPFVVGEDGTSVNVDVKYLFGAPAGGAPWESRLRIVPHYFSHPDWRAFTFPSGTISAPSGDVENSGNLDEKGQASISVSPDSEWKGSALSMSLTVRVREDGGRWVARNITIPYYKNPVLLGYEMPRQEPQAGTPYSIRVAAVSPDGKASGLKSVTAVAEIIQDYYVRSDRGYTRTTKYTPVSTVSVPLTDGAGVFTFTPPKRAEYRIRVFEPGSDAKTAMTTQLSVWSGLAASDDGGSPLIDRVMLSWDKQKYAVGETANLKVRSPFPGKLLIVLEGEKEVYRQVVPMKGAETTVRVPVLNSMLPNAYVSAWVIRPVRENETWGAHRAFGVIPLTVDRSASKVGITLTAPEKTLPKGEMPVSLALKDASGKPVRGEVALAFVDEGLLSLTNFATPDPFSFFTAKRGMQGMVYDLYDNLMPLSTKKPLSLHPAGGEGGDGSLLSPMNRKLELLSIFLGTVTTDAEGKAAVTLTLPEYSGKGRLMAVAVTDAGVGSASSQIRVARDVTVEATVPRMVAPGDLFTAPVLVFGDGEKSRKAKITFTTEGPLSVEGVKEFQVSLDAKTPKVAISLPVKAGSAADMGALRIITKIEGTSDAPFEQRLEIPVRPPFPRLTKSGGGVVRAGESATIDVGGGFFAGTQKVTLSFSDAPSVSLVKALSFLGSYPYGCLEQTTSSAWPYLAVPQMLKSLDPEKAQDTEFKMALDFAVRRILAMQRPDGGFNYWPGASRSDNAYAWGSVYAAHFLTEAKSSGLVPPDALKAALGWLRSYLAGSLPEKGDWQIMDALSAKAYIAYVLTLNGDAPLGWMQFLKDQGKFLSPSARIFLAGAYAVATGKSAPLRELGTNALPEFGYTGWSLESTPRNEALRLLMWASVDPFAAETAELAKRVMEDGNKNRWRSTQENALAVLALGRYAEKTATKSKNYEATLSGQTQIAAFTHGKNPVFTRKDLTPAAPAAPGPLTVKVTGEGATYYAWTTSGVPVKAPEPFSEGLFVGRRWILPDGKVIDFMEFDKDGKPATAARNLKIPQGAKVTVVLYVQPKASMNSLVLADIVPGGFEIDNPNLVPDGDSNSAAAGTLIDPKTKKPIPAPKVFGNAYSLNSSMESRTEMRDDRLLLFVNQLPARSGVFIYTLRAVSKGTFVLPPVSAEAMYEPEVRALTAPGTVTVE